MIRNVKTHAAKSSNRRRVEANLILTCNIIRVVLTVLVCLVCIRKVTGSVNINTAFVLDVTPIKSVKLEAQINEGILSYEILTV